MKLGSTIATSLIVLISIVVSGLIMEYATRWLFPALSPSGQVRIVAGENGLPNLGPRNSQVRQTKNSGEFDVSVSFNKYGLRDDKDLASAKPEDIFLVGDSLIFGWGVEEEDRISEKLEAIIDRKVYNLGIPTDLDGYEKVIKYINSLGADVQNVLLAISMETNIKNYENDTQSVPGNRAARNSGILMKIKQFLMGNSSLYFLVTSFIHKNETLKKQAIRFGLIIPNLEGVSHQTYSREFITSTARRTAEIASKYMTTVFLAPSRGLWHGSKSERKTTRRIHDEFVFELDKFNIDVIDLRDTFETSGEPLRYYFTTDSHWNASGHSIAAKALAEYLKDRALKNVPAKFN